MDPLPKSPPELPKERIYRHRAPVRLMHWINVLCLTVLLGSGLTIFNAHPALYWGRQATFADPWVWIGTSQGKGVTNVAGHQFATDGVLGASRVGDDTTKTQRAFPS